MQAVHQIRADHEHEFEAEHGLPEPLPRGERILWQGAPDWRVLALRAFHLRKLALYFGALIVLRVLFVLDDGGDARMAFAAAVWLASIFGICLGMLAALAFWSARTAVYTLTDKRLVMRVGIVLSLTFNLPLKRLDGAALAGTRGSDGAGDGVGDIALMLRPPDRIAWLNLWPHARPWKVKRPEPMLRCVPNAHAVATLLRSAWLAQNGIEAPTAAAAARLPEGDSVRPAAAAPQALAA